MTRDYYDMVEFDEIPSEEEILEQEAQEFEEMLEGMPDVYWKEDLAAIEDPELREREVDRAVDLLAKQEALDGRLRRGEIDQSSYEMEMTFDLRRQKAHAATGAGLASVGLKGDHLGEVSQEQGFILDAAAAGDTDNLDRIGELEHTVDLIGPDQAQKLADEQLKNGDLSSEAHQLISRKARLGRLKD